MNKLTRRLQNIKRYLFDKESKNNTPVSTKKTLNKGLHKKRSFVRSNAWYIIKKNIPQFLGVWVLIWFLIFLLNLLLMVSYGSQKTSDEIQNKLGIYLYIRENSSAPEETYSRVIELKEKLEKIWVKAVYTSKDDAIKQISQKIPSVVNSFEEYGIGNPLPATLYVTFDGLDQFTKVKELIRVYEDIISNKDATSNVQNIQQQEKRVLDIIWFADVVVGVSYFLVGMLILIIFTFLLYVIRIKYYSYNKTIEIWKLIWAKYKQIKMPFIISMQAIMTSGFVLAFLLCVVWFYRFSGYTTEIFGGSVRGIVGKDISFLSISFVLQYGVMLILAYLIWSVFLERLLKSDHN